MVMEQQVFTPAEVEALRADDRSAATAIVGLMAGIFTLGLIGYIGVCLWVGLRCGVVFRECGVSSPLCRTP
jgi:hypothetical protein